MRFLGHWIRQVGSLLLLVSTTTFCEADLINVALNKPTETSAVYSTFNGSFAVDGNYQTHWAAPSHATAINPHWLVVDLGSSFTVDKITLTGPSSTYVGYTHQYNLYRGATPTAWTLIGSGTLIDTTDPQDTWIPGGNAMRYVKFEVVGGTHWAGLYEMEVFAVPEPSSIALLTFSAAIAGIVSRYRRKK